MYVHSLVSLCFYLTWKFAALLVTYSECEEERRRHQTTACQGKPRGALTVTVLDVPENGLKYTAKMVKFLNVLSVK